MLYLYILNYSFTNPLSEVVSCCFFYRVSCTVRCRAFAPRNAEPQALVVADQAGGESLPGSTGTGLQVEGKPAAPPLSWEVVVLGPERCGGDGILWLHHALPQYSHGNCSTGATESFHRCVMLSFMKVYTIYL